MIGQDDNMIGMATLAWCYFFLETSFFWSFCLFEEDSDVPNGFEGRNVSLLSLCLEQLNKAIIRVLFCDLKVQVGPGRTIKSRGLIENARKTDRRCTNCGHVVQVYNISSSK